MLVFGEATCDFLMRLRPDNVATMMRTHVSLELSELRSLDSVFLGFFYLVRCVFPYCVVVRY